jgi:hypothetical protein
MIEILVMPKLDTTKSNYTCFMCGRQAFFISVNSKQPRCVNKITQCIGFVKKAEESRQSRMSKEDRLKHMKKMSEKGNATLKELHTNKEWVSVKGKKISDAVKFRGGHFGEKNPMFGKNHSKKSLELLTERANNRNPECYSTATDTKIKRGLAIPKEQKTEWELYKEQVLNYTYKSWQYYQNDINPNGLQRGPEYELDHKFSISEGFKQNVNPKIIGHDTNLELLPKDVNRSKRIKCSITLEELIERTKF